MSEVLANKVAIVTGGGRGLGRTFALALQAAGADVMVASRKADDLNRVVEEADALAGGSVVAQPTDVISEESVQALIDATVRRFGHVDILVNNSGVVLSKPLAETAANEWDQVVATNLRGTFLTTKAVGQCMIQAGGGGKVINVASNFGLKGIPNHAAYSSSKAAVVGFTRSVAVEWARYNIQVNALAPGYFVTDMNAEVRADADMLPKVLKTIPARRLAEARELAPWVVALAGPASDFMTGEVIVIDGGQTVA